MLDAAAAFFFLAGAFVAGAFLATGFLAAGVFFTAVLVSFFSAIITYLNRFRMMRP